MESKSMQEMKSLRGMNASYKKRHEEMKRRNARLEKENEDLKEQNEWLRTMLSSHSGTQ